MITLKEAIALCKKLNVQLHYNKGLKKDVKGNIFTNFMKGITEFKEQTI